MESGARKPGSSALRIGVIGAGRIGSFHVRTLVSLPRVAGVTVCDADGARARSVAGELGIGVAATPEDLVACGIDALVIATPTPTHVPMIQLAARAGLPAFCEKPVALDLTALDAAIDDVERAGILVQIGFQRRFDAGYRAARQALTGGALGRLLIARAATHDPSPPAETYIAGSGGIFRDLHIHDFDALRFVTGEEIVEVYADGAVRETPWFADHDDVDVAAAVLKLSGGALAILSGTRHDPLGYDVRLELFGTRDSVVAGLDARSPIRSLEAGGAQPASHAYADFMERFHQAYQDELAAFVATVIDGGPSACTLHEARAALCVALAADRSRIERRPVAVGEVASTPVPAG
ncbi:MAG TPA: Gfo/Idh/MocA family oxidoreductase [Gaiellales bacterium]|jgi:myo-inositol 2-dehydrogenase/D-chiro-inositol 1-dehydrogenase|nr:Gfo/Idh/MocA family oxidoreductase [Gaiellales bacterium]